MPELAEVERGRRLLETAIQGKKIVKVSTQQDARVFVGNSASILEKALPGRTVVAVKRHGKNVYLDLDGQGPTLAFHLGMTGSVGIKDGEFHYRRPRYIKRISASWPPWRWKMLLMMDDATEVCTIDTSRFGRIRAVDDPDAMSIPPLSLLARDAWLDLPTSDELRAELNCRTTPIKTVLLDQNAVVSGLGNYNVDEILFQARIHPRQPSYTLDVNQAEALHAAIGLVAAKVMEVDADTKKLPKTWLYKHRYGRKDGIGQTFVVEDGTSTHVTHDRINGRITAITDLQVLGDYSGMPLPKKRKLTVVDLEDGENGSGEDDSGVDGGQEACKPIKKRRRKADMSEKRDLVLLAGRTKAEGEETPSWLSENQKVKTVSGHRESVQIEDTARRFSARLRQKQGL